MTSGDLSSAHGKGLLFREVTEELKIAVDSEDGDAKKIAVDSEDGDAKKLSVDSEDGDAKKIVKPDVSLADGMPLPKYLRNDFPDDLFGKLIHEIDPFYDKKNTFVVISTNWVIHRFSSLKSLWLLTPLNGLRRFCIRTITHWIFRYFMIVTMLFYAFFYSNMAFIKWHVPFLTIFTVEMYLKIIAQGFLLQPFSYLQNPWNWIDFLLTQIGLTLGFVSRFLHPIHSLRMLRLIHFFTHSRLTCSWVFRSLHRMKDPFLFGAFLFFMFTIYAQQFLAGVLSNRCIQETQVPWTSYGINRNTTKVQIITLPYVCGNWSGSRACPNDGFVCKESFQNPDHGYTSFDNFPMAAISIMRLMARDYWDKLYMQIHSAVGPREFPFILAVIVYGSYYYVNLLLAYIAVGITEMLQILEGKKPKRKLSTVKSSKRNSDDSVASEKEKASDGIEERDLVQVIDVNLIDIDAQNHTKEVALEQPTTSVQIDRKDDGSIEEEISFVYRRRRTPLASCCMPMVDSFCDWNCCSCWVEFRKKLTVVVQTIYFNVFIGLCIVLNAVMCSLHHRDASFTTVFIIPWTEYIISIIFIIEAILKILALSPRHYFKDSMNVLDFFVVLVIVMEFALIHLTTGVTILRLFRAFRLFGTASWWPYFDDLMKICGTNLWALYIVLLTFARMAEGIFNDRYFDGDISHSRWNFSSFWNSVLTVFRMVCGEWIEPLWECLPGNSDWHCIPYFISVVVVGNLVVFTLFVTMLAVALNSNNLSATEPISNRNLIAVTRNVLSFSWCSRFRQPKRLEEQAASKSREELFNMSVDEEARMPATQSTLDINVVAPCWCDSCYKFLPCCGSTSGASNPASHTKFWSTWDSFRIGSLRLIHNDYFGYGMNTFIILSCITQAWNDHNLDGYNWHMAFYIMNYFVIIIYPLEICLQMSAIGCKKYFSNGWHLFDFLISVLHIISIAVTSCTGAFSAPFGFRPLKLIPRLKRLKLVISATFDKLSSLVDVLLACCILWLFFAVFGVYLFGGRFSSCINDSGVLVFEVDQKSQCHSMAANGFNVSWQIADYNFDDVGHAFVSLLLVASRRGWITIMLNAIDSRYIDYQPKPNSNVHTSFYFYSFLILGVLCCFTFILATFLKKANEQQKQVGGYVEILMTELQRQEFARKKNNFFISPVKVSPCPELWPRRLAYRLVFSSKFKLMVILFTTFNAVGLALITLQASILMASAIFDIDIVFFLVFALEVLLRTAAFGRNFFARNWNIYDFVVLVASVFVYTLHPFFPEFVPSPLLFGMFRIVRLVRWLKWVRRIASRLMLYLPALNNIALLLFVIILTYGSMAFGIFRHVRFADHDIDHLDFAYFGSALMSVTMIGFGSSWDVIIGDIEGSHWFVFSFLAIFYLIIIQAGAVLFLEHYHLLEEKRRMSLSDDALEAFETAWKILDPSATGYIACDYLSEFLNSMLPPFQICHPNQDEIAALNVPIYKDDNVAFNDVLLALLARLDDQEINVQMVQNRDDIISSTLKRHQEAEAKTAEQELEEK